MSHRERVPDLLLEKLSLGELSPGEERAVREALAQEPGGARRVQALERSNREILSAYPPGPALAEIHRRAAGSRARARRRRWLVGAAPALAAAAAAALLLLGPWRQLAQPPTGGSGRHGDGIREKGGALLVIYRKTRTGHERLAHGDLVRAGDLLQLQVKAGREAHGVILSTDGRGQVTLHFPVTAAASTRLRPGKARMLSFAYQLDDAPAFERFVLVTARRRIDVKAVVAAARATGTRRHAALALPRGLTTKEVLLLKRNDDGGPG